MHQLTPRIHNLPQHPFDAYVNPESFVISSNCTGGLHDLPVKGQLESPEFILRLLTFVAVKSYSESRGDRLSHDIGSFSLTVFE